MDIRPDFEGFTWARGQYTLSADRQFILRDPDAPTEPYTPDVRTVETIVGAAPDEDGALAVVQRVGFLSVHHSSLFETVPAWTNAAGNLKIMEAAGDFADGGPPAELPQRWTESMDTAPFAKQIKLPDGRVLMGEEKKLHELGLAQQDEWKRRAQRMRQNPPSADDVARHALAFRASVFNERAGFRVRATIDLRADPAELVLRPATLADWCWYRLAGTVTGTIVTRQCLNYLRCRGTFEVDLTDGNSAKRKYCPATEATCKSSYHYHNRKPKTHARKKGARRHGK